MANKITSAELFNTLMGVESMAINTIIALFNENGLTEMKMDRYTVVFDVNSGISIVGAKTNDKIDISDLTERNLVTVLKDCEDFVNKM